MITHANLKWYKNPFFFFLLKKLGMMLSLSNAPLTCHCIIVKTNICVCEFGGDCCNTNNQVLCKVNWKANLGCRMNFPCVMKYQFCIVIPYGSFYMGYRLQEKYSSLLMPTSPKVWKGSISFFQKSGFTYVRLHVWFPCSRFKMWWNMCLEQFAPSIFDINVQLMIMLGNDNIWDKIRH